MLTTLDFHLTMKMKDAMLKINQKVRTVTKQALERVLFYLPKKISPVYTRLKFVN
ncbi:hypothetical protein SAMN04488574_1536 [Bacillus sp. 71mf]|nr:hypothetical protein SAMN04488574_1536 [Bacillus sp. 71mf]SFT23375.1 hypothetical protein SAMN04488145_1296 [Bacillus sp. 103mf]